MAFAGAAAAEVKLSGSAEMGIAGGNNGAETLFHTSVDVRFSLRGETDGGLSFGATVDLEDATERADDGPHLVDNKGTLADYNVFIKGAFGTLTMGDTDGAFDWALTEVAMLTSIADDHTGHDGFNGNSGMDGDYNGQVARYDYSFGDFGVAVSAELDATGADDAIFGLGAKWSGDMGAMALGVGVGFQSNGDNDIAGASVKVSSAGFDVVVNYSDLDGLDGKDSHAAIGVGYSTGALSLTANYGTYDLAGGGDEKGWGAAANYDLGGGAVVMVGYGDSDGGDATWSAGLGLSF